MNIYEPNVVRQAWWTFIHLWHKDSQEQNTMILQSDFIITLTLLSRVPCRTPLLGSNRLKFNFQSSSISCTKNWLTKKPYLYWFYMHVFCCSIWSWKSFPAKICAQKCKNHHETARFPTVVSVKVPEVHLVTNNKQPLPAVPKPAAGPFPWCFAVAWQIWKWSSDWLW